MSTSKLAAMPSSCCVTRVQHGGTQGQHGQTAFQEIEKSELVDQLQVSEKN